MKKAMIILIAFLLGIAFGNNTFAYEDEMVDIHGFISQGYLISDHNNFMAPTDGGTAEFNELGVNFASTVSDNLRIGLQLYARDLGHLGNNEVTVDWAFADYRWKDWLGIRAGQMKFVSGLYNKTRDVDMLRTPIFLPQSVYKATWRDIESSIRGTGIYGNISSSLLGDFDYIAYAGVLSIDPNDGVIDSVENRVPFGSEINTTQTNIDGTYDFALQWNTPLDGLILNQSVWHIDWKLDSEYTKALEFKQGMPLPMPMPTPAGTIPAGTPAPQDIVIYPVGYEQVIDSLGEAWTSSIEYTFGDLIIAAEYVKTDYHVNFENSIFPKNEFTALGYYGMLSYRLTDWLEVGCYYSEYFGNDDDKDGDKAVADAAKIGEKIHDYQAWLKDACLTFRFDINESWLLKLEGHSMNGTALLIDELNPDEDGDGYSDTEEDWYLFAAKMTYSF